MGSVDGRGDACLDCGSAEELRRLPSSLVYCAKCFWARWRAGRLPSPPTAPEPVTLDSPDGRGQRFRFDVSWLASGWLAVEMGEGDFGSGHNASTGYHFSALGPLDGSGFDEQVAFVRLAAERALGHLYLEPTEPDGRLLLRGDAVEGRLIWAGGQPGMREPYAVVVDGRPMSWDDFGRALEPFEGFRFRLTVEEDNVVVSDLDPQPKG
jgi:hypothetical protein